MNTFKFIPTVVLAAVAMAACKGDDEVTGGSDGRAEVKFSANTAEIQTRVTNSSWAADDPVGIYMIDADEDLATEHIKEGADNREYRSAAGTGNVSFTEAGSKIYYPMSGNVEFIAYHPYSSSVEDFKLPVNVGTQTDQSAIDVLYAPKTNGGYNKSKKDVPVNLQFTHRLVKLAFTIGKGAGVTESLDNLTVKITGQKTEATLDLTDGTVTPSSVPTSAITANTVTDGSAYEAIVLPNTGVSDMTFTFTTAAGGVYEVTVPTPTTDSKWEPGYKYAYTVTLKRNEASITGSVSDWGDGGAYLDVTAIPQTHTIKGYTGNIQVQYADAPPVSISASDIGTIQSGQTVKSITLTDKGGVSYYIGRVVDPDNLIHLKFDSNGDLLFRDASEDGFIPIGSYAEFQLIADYTRNNYRLETDLNLMDEEWTPIANDGDDFVGEFDGAGKKISNLKINKSGQNNKGLFRKNHGTIRNVHIASGTITVGGYSGGICGQNQTSGQIISCSNAATVSGHSDCVGGVVGWNQSGAVTACNNTGTVSGIYDVGGVVGNNSSGTVTACYNTGAVSGTSGLSGGVVGQNQSLGTVTACYNTGTVSGADFYVGGVVGINNDGSVITACYWESGTAPDNGVGTKFPDFFTPSGSDAWNTGDGTNGYWKPGINYENTLPKLWWE
ncbi:MAG: fimbrillin family protein [Bacteroidales bacterium]|jgi:hypothetical protein|nr:fimbrillin family protein [Bacteroidales bacterium]